MPRISALIPCKNERSRLPLCLDSLLGCVDEIVVADNGSTDGTLEYLAKRPDVRLIEREYVNPADFKNWAATLCTHDWVLGIDCDETVDPELALALNAFRCRPAPTDADAYRVRRRNQLFGKEIRFTSWRRDSILALYRRDACRYRPGRVHEGLDVHPTRIGRLPGAYLHDSIVDFADYLEKTHRYTDWAAAEMLLSRRGGTATHMVLQPPLKFVREYLLCAGFIDGVHGLIVSAMASYYVFLKHAKTWDLRRERRAADGTSDRNRAPNETEGDGENDQTNAAA